MLCCFCQIVLMKWDNTREITIHTIGQYTNISDLWSWTIHTHLIYKESSHYKLEYLIYPFPGHAENQLWLFCIQEMSVPSRWMWSGGRCISFRKSWSPELPGRCTPAPSRAWTKETVLLFSCWGGLIGGLFRIVLGKQGGYGLSCNGMRHLKQVFISVTCYCQTRLPSTRCVFFNHKPLVFGKKIGQRSMLTVKQWDFKKHPP